MKFWMFFFVDLFEKANNWMFKGGRFLSDFHGFNETGTKNATLQPTKTYNMTKISFYFKCYMILFSYSFKNLKKSKIYPQST